MDKRNKTICKRTKAMILSVGLIAVLSVGMVACSPGKEDSAQRTDDIDKTAYPAHVENAKNGAGMASFHTALGYDCADCHVDDLDTEVAKITECSTTESDGTEPPLASAYYTDNETCLGCHGGSWEALAEKTSDLGDYNPHNSIHGTIQYCNECHKGHTEQVDICGECHPNGGQTMKSILVE